ncbi:MAG: phosphoglycolate phosphatase [Candidatus Woesearchaeota archaeon]|nr:phosphoglycolate phosphatase [Candidatus Woesearchaeota archaeon]
MKVYPKDALIFDFDGVIADSIDFFKECYNRAAKESFIKQISRQETKKILSENPKRLLFPDEPLINKAFFFSNMIKEMQKNVEGIKLIEGMKGCIEYLFIENELYISSKNLPKVINQFLISHELIDYFSIIYSLRLNKRSSFKKILLKHKKENTLFITDTYNDIVNANRIGIDSIGCSWGIDSLSKLKQAKPFYIARSPKELIKAVEIWKNR